MIVNFIILHSPCAQDWPSEGVDDFRDVHVSFFLRCKDLSLRVLRLMALGLDLEPEVFLNTHKHIGSKYKYALLLPPSESMAHKHLYAVICIKVL